MSDIIREVDEELRRENWETLWRKYGKLIIAAALALVLGTAGVVGWREYDRSQREAAGGVFGTVIAEVENSEKPGVAADILAAYIPGAPDGYAMLARDAGVRDLVLTHISARYADNPAPVRYVRRWSSSSMCILRSPRPAVCPCRTAWKA